MTAVTAIISAANSNTLGCWRENARWHPANSTALQASPIKKKYCTAQGNQAISCGRAKISRIMDVPPAKVRVDLAVAA
ncbi:Uncharacterised protein [Yersinia enterocolitica]|nr:Uncharacterised protein [Yersinia enterocolitica]